MLPRPSSLGSVGALGAAVGLSRKFEARGAGLAADTVGEAVKSVGPWLKLL